MTVPKLAVSDSPLARSLLRDRKLTVLLETGGPLTASAVAEFPAYEWLLHNSVWNWSLAHPQALEQQAVVAVSKEALAHPRTLAERPPRLQRGARHLSGEAATGFRAAGARCRRRATYPQRQCSKGRD